MKLSLKQKFEFLTGTSEAPEYRFYNSIRPVMPQKSKTWWCELPILATNATAFHIEFELNSYNGAPGYQGYLCSFIGDFSFANYATDYNYLEVRGQMIDSNIFCPLNERQTFDYDNNGVSLGKQNRNLHLWTGINTGGRIRNSDMTLYHLSIETINNGTYEFIPAMRTVDGKLGLFDENHNLFVPCTGKYIVE